MVAPSCHIPFSGHHRVPAGSPWFWWMLCWPRPEVNGSPNTSVRRPTARIDSERGGGLEVGAEGPRAAREQEVDQPREPAIGRPDEEASPCAVEQGVADVVDGPAGGVGRQVVVPRHEAGRQPQLRGVDDHGLPGAADRRLPAVDVDGAAVAAGGCIEVQVDVEPAALVVGLVPVMAGERAHQHPVTVERHGYCLQDHSCPGEVRSRPGRCQAASRRAAQPTSRSRHTGTAADPGSHCSTSGHPPA